MTVLKIQRHSTTADLIKETNSKRSILNSVIAGYTAGVSGVLAGHPMGSAKVWLQTNKRLSYAANANHGSKRGMSTVAAAAAAAADSAIKNESAIQKIRALYAGVSGPLLTVGIMQSLNFAVYDTTRRFLYGRDREGQQYNEMDYLDNDSMENVAIAGLTAGTVMSFFTSPLLVVKTQQQTSGATLKQALRSATYKNLYVGFTPHFFVETINRAVYFCTYESCKRYLSKDRPSVSLTDRMISAAAAGTACWVGVYPLDAIRARLYALPYETVNDRTLSSSWRHMVSQMYAENGIKAFYRGFGLTMIRAGPVAAFILPVYDIVLENLSDM